MAVAPADADWTSIPPAVTLGGVFGQILHAEPSDPSADQAVLHVLKLTASTVSGSLCCLPNP